MIITKIIKPKFNIPTFTEKSILSVDCGEQILPVGGACLLGSINLTQFINADGGWDYNALKSAIPVAVRFMDNVNDLTYVPLDAQKAEIKAKRRIGLGIMGYGSALYLLKVRYGSKEALKLTDEIMTFISNQAYQASALLAKEKGAFPAYDAQKYLVGQYIKTLSKETLALISEHGLRNSHLMSIQPTGNTSTMVNIVSGGLEPVFLPEFVRTAIIPHAPDGLDVPFNIDWENKKFDINDVNQKWVWIKEGDEPMLSTIYENITYKIDRNRGLLKESLVMDYAVRILKENGTWDKDAEWAASSDKLTIDDHINTMNVFSKHICSAMSKTINLPNDYSFEDFKDVYFKAFNTGTIKGVTTYRVGTMATVLSEKKNAAAKTKAEINPKERNGHIVRCQAPHRPKSVPCDIHHLTVGGQRWTVFIGLVHDDTEELTPYEVFAFKKKSISLPERVEKGTLTKMKRGKYNLSTADGLELEDISSLFDTDEQQSVTRLISLGLRHGADIKFIVEQLSKASGSFVDFSKAIAKVLKTYIKDNEKVSGDDTCPNCNRTNALVYQEGCVKCKFCELSLC